MRANFILILWILVGFILAVVAGMLAAETSSFQSRARVLPGRVEGSTDGRSGSTTVPMVRFLVDGEEREYRYKSFFGASESYFPGTSVSILYDAQSGEVRLDDFSELYLGAALLGFVSFLVLSPLLAGMLIFVFVWGFPTPKNMAALRKRVRGETG